MKLTLSSLNTGRNLGLLAAAVLLAGIGANVATLQQSNWSIPASAPIALREAEFLQLRGDAVAEMPEIVVTPDCTFNRYQSEGNYYLFTSGALVRVSPSPDVRVRKYCPGSVGQTSRPIA